MSQRNTGRLQHRAEILSSAGLLEAPKAMQSLFWQRYNLERTRRRMPAMLGDLAATAWPEAAQAIDGTVRRIDSAWQRVLPAEYAEAARVEGFRSGRLLVSVDSAATRYVLERQLGDKIREALNAELGSNEISRIEFRLGRPAADRKTTIGKRMRQRGTQA